ncbi:MAG: nickel-dependent hydrogenase large subunit [Deltaproteobacteria bacterium]|nr:nickel-dependent hydrogenase large subunit [Deltaproteobacteria bacterium]
MARKIIDPITRIEGHLRIEVELDGNRVVDAWSSGMMFRGIETILRNRDPRDAPLMTQRICGVCTHVHYDASIWAVENAFGITPPPAARIVRNLILGTQLVQDHIIQFYHLHGLDWVDIVSALGADPKKAQDLAHQFADDPWNADAKHLEAVKNRLAAFAKSGQLGPFANGYWGNPSYKLPPEANLLIASHYLDALDVQRLGGQVLAVLGGKEPHTQTLVVGGVTCVEDLLNPKRIGDVLFRIRKLGEFVRRAYIPDVLLAGSVYAEEGLQGIGAGHGNYLAYGAYPLSDDLDRGKLFMPQGVILGKDLTRVYDFDPAKVSEYVTHSWYTYGDESQGIHPSKGVTEVQYTDLGADGHVRADGKYSWLKAPRYDGRPMEVGPLARVLVAYARGVPEVRALVDGTLKRLGAPATVLFSTLGRTAARALETRWVADALPGWVEELVRVMKVDGRTFAPYTLPDEAVGFGLTEAPRGALGHWVEVRGGRIANYQCVVPTTWNAGPRDAKGVRGPYEQSLVGIELADPDQPLEILRTIHSFDPCIACAVHLLRHDGPSRAVRVL